MRLGLQYTGNPFVDAGYDIFALHHKKPLQDITEEEVISLFNVLASKLYSVDSSPDKTVKTWKSWIGSIIFYGLGGKEGLQVGSTRKLRSDFVKKFTSQRLSGNMEYQNVGNCSICGHGNSISGYNKKVKQLQGSRSVLPLLGSADEVNAMMSSLGEPICLRCLAGAWAMPLSLYCTYGHFTLFRSSDSILTNAFYSSIYGENLRNASLLSETGSDTCNMPSGTYFDLLERIINVFSNVSNKLDENVPPVIQLYAFRNNPQNLYFNKYVIPDQRAGVLMQISQDKELRDGWRKLSGKNGYRFAMNFLEGSKSLYGFVNTRERTVSGNLKLFRLYLRRIVDMTDDMVVIIEQMGEKLVAYCKETDSIKPLQEIERTKFHNDHLRTITSLARKYVSWSGKPFLTFSEFQALTKQESMENVKTAILFYLYEGLAKEIKENSDSKTSDNTEKEGDGIDG